MRSLFFRIIRSFLFSLISFLLALLVGLNQTAFKLQLHFFVSGHLTLHPWVSDNVSYAKSLVWIVLQHVVNQVFEILRVVGLAFGESSTLIRPKLIIFISSNQLIKPILWWNSLTECRKARVQNKKYGAERENVNNLPMVDRVFNKQFRRHIRFSPTTSGKSTASISALNRSCISKVSDSNIEQVVNQDIIRL